MKIIYNYAEKNWLDKEVVRLLKDNYGEVIELTHEKQMGTRALFEKEFIL